MNKYDSCAVVWHSAFPAEDLQETQPVQLAALSPLHVWRGQVTHARTHEYMIVGQRFHFDSFHIVGVLYMLCSPHVHCFLRQRHFSDVL